MQSLKQQYYGGLDLMKFICSIMVIMIHIHPFSSINATLDYYTSNCICRIAVPFFFITAGYLLYQNASTHGTHVVKTYIHKLLKLYIIWSIIYLPVNHKEIIQDHSRGYALAILNYFKNFLFVGSYRHLWFLNALIFATILISILLIKGVNIRRIVGIAAMLYITGLLLGQSYFGLIRNSLGQTTFWTIFCKTLVTSRNGLFFGFLFVSIGIYIAQNKSQKSYNIKPTIVGLVLSLMIFILEVLCVRNFNLINEYDMYITLIPTGYFTFQLGKNLQINRQVGLHCRNLSQLIFYLHLAIRFAVNAILKTIRMEFLLSNSLLYFIIIFTVTIVIAEFIINLSRVPKFQWLKCLYS